MPVFTDVMQRAIKTSHYLQLPYSQFPLYNFVPTTILLLVSTSDIACRHLKIPSSLSDQLSPLEF